MYAVQAQPGRLEPLCERRNGCRVAIVEVTARCEQLDALEPVPGYLREVAPIELLIVVEVCRYPEPHVLSGFTLAREPLIVPVHCQHCQNCQHCQHSKSLRRRRVDLGNA